MAARCSSARLREHRTPEQEESLRSSFQNLIGSVPLCYAPHGTAFERELLSCGCEELKSICRPRSTIGHRVLQQLQTKRVFDKTRGAIRFGVLQKAPGISFAEHG